MPEESMEDALGRAAYLLIFGAAALAGGPIGIASFILGELPIWRVPRHPEEGVGGIDYVYKMVYEVEHIPIEQAIEEARQYYLEVAD